MPTTITYFIRDGRPRKETRVTNAADQIVSISDPYDEDTDTLTDQTTYDSMLAAEYAAAQADSDSIHQAQRDLLDDNTALKASIKTKLLSDTTLTSDEIDALLSGI